MMNETIRKFGHPATLIRDYAYWVALLRPAQVTLGSLVLAAKADATDFAALPEAAFAEMRAAAGDIAAALGKAVEHEKINYIMLMMVDPHVHFHVLPRYEGTRSGAGLTIADKGWPGQPDLGSAVKLGEDEIARMVEWLKDYWP
jgi:diadenosine tetraphosphate (Ap4A) HIT family hydrolase